MNLPPVRIIPQTVPLAETLFSQEQIRHRIGELAIQIEEDLEGSPPIFLAVLKGSVMFLADLVRAMKGQVDIDFLSISSYAAAGERTGVVRIVKDVEILIEGRDVIVIEDIVDTGLTLAFLLRTLQTRNPKTLRVCTLIDKPVRRIVEPPIDYVGFVTDSYVVGYGLDFKGRYRNLPYMVGVDDVAALAADPDALKPLLHGADED